MNLDSKLKSHILIRMVKKTQPPLGTYGSLSGITIMTVTSSSIG
jgi:hypothetical protein